MPTRYGTSRAIVHEVGLSDATMPAALRQHLKTITAECLIADDGEHQEQMDLNNPVDDFFKIHTSTSSFIPGIFSAGYKNINKYSIKKRDSCHKKVRKA